MSRQPHLPPRCPFQKKTITRLIHDPVSPSPCKDTKVYPRHHKSVSQSSIFDEQPEWLDDLLSDSDSNSKGIFHRRTASDSATLLDGLAPLRSLNTFSDGENSGSGENCSVLEAACMYGPNSPRRKGKLTFAEDAMVTALSEYASRNPMQDLEGGLFISGTAQLDSVQDACGSTGEVIAEIDPVKRHSGQRSRVRKLQYIAELEKTVDTFQTLESELAVRVDSLLQQRVALSMENCKLKQQVARLQQEKLFANGQYQSLRKEVERLKLGLACSPNRKVSTNFSSSFGTEAVNSEATWKMLDMGKLDLNRRSR